MRPFRQLPLVVAQGPRGGDGVLRKKYLHVLRELRLIDREVPITDPDPLRSRKGRYRISDRFLAFHFRFLQPNLSLVHAGRGERVLSGFVRPQMDALFDDARVDFIMDHNQNHADRLGYTVGVNQFADWGLLSAAHDCFLVLEAVHDFDADRHGLYAARRNERDDAFDGEPSRAERVRSRCNHIGA